MALAVLLITTLLVPAQALVCGLDLRNMAAQAPALHLQVEETQQVALVQDAGPQRLRMTWFFQGMGLAAIMLVGVAAADGILQKPSGHDASVPPTGATVHPDWNNAFVLPAARAAQLLARPVALSPSLAPVSMTSVNKKAKAASRKQKTSSAAKKRFKATSTGKLLHHFSGKAHLLRKKRPQKLASLRRVGNVNDAELRTYQKLVGIEGKVAKMAKKRVGKVANAELKDTAI